MMTQEVRTHKDLVVWQKGIDLVVSIDEATKLFPSNEMYVLTSQIRRCAASIPANIAEGSGRKGNNEFKHFLYIALGSATELETHLIIAERLGYLDDNQFDALNVSLVEIIRMLSGLIRSVN